MTHTIDQVGVFNGKSLPTFYGGVTFRSRTEARWAVFMDQLGLGWHYEHEGFQLPGGKYLPDFWVPSISSYLEIKPSNFVTGRIVGGRYEPSREWVKCGQLAALTGRRVLLFLGSPGEQGPAQPNSSPYASVSGDDSAIAIWPAVDIPGESEGYCSDQPYCWCVCPKCGKYGVEFDGRGGRVCAHSEDEKAYSSDHPSLLAAYATAEAWRFR